MTFIVTNTSDVLTTVTGSANSADPLGNIRGQVRRIKAIAHPTQNTNVGTPELVQFSLPFCREELTTPSNIKADDGSEELPISAHKGLDWHNWNGDPSSFIRSAIVTVQLNFANTTDPVEFWISWGGSDPTIMLPLQPDQLNWVSYRDSGIQFANYTNIVEERRPVADFDATKYGLPEETIMEPRTWVTLEPEYLRYSEVFTPYTSFKSGTYSNNFEVCKVFYEKALETTANIHGNHVKEGHMSPFMFNGNNFYSSDDSYSYSPSEGSGYATWLFDRASVYAQRYIMTGNLSDLQLAHRNMYFYNTKVVSGVFTPKQIAANQVDIKYVYSRPAITDMLLVGNTEHLSKITEITPKMQEWDHVYVYNDQSNTFWTERHAAYKLSALICDWEYTGRGTIKDEIETMFEDLFAMQQTPVNNGAKDGSFRHTLGSHEGFGGFGLVGSPWMSVLLLGPIVTYFEHSLDPRALTCMYDLSQYISNYALAYGNSVKEYAPDDLMPYYIIGEGGAGTNGSWLDNSQHAWDVMHIMARGKIAADILGHDYTNEIAQCKELLLTSANTFNYYNRPSQAAMDAGLTFWRVNPNRKANWWFGSQNPSIFNILGDL